MLHGLTWKDFIVYPSYLNEGYSCNMAIHPNTADKYLEFKKVIRFKLQSKVGNYWTISTGHYGEVKNTNIVWKMAALGNLTFQSFRNSIGLFSGIIVKSALQNVQLFILYCIDQPVLIRNSTAPKTLILAL